ncbi:LPXTG cell wall anchor domain-containing protein [uncultured Limosilactobacillus sp.]|uniref:LPXTG cell wall anchor domain-containing protein n=1 Tax=uncultured Limosilactobacillus sp. TaxID=2837629 RepID=UPI0025DE459F|nr:LPXTG cell wall anchor domain-containing protein [uncultured Limosilactobacillus sp.]
MKQVKRYKIYKHHKQWLIGCSSLLLPLLVGMSTAHADEVNTTPSADQPNVVNTEPASQQHSSADRITSPQNNLTLATPASVNDSAPVNNRTATNQNNNVSQPQSAPGETAAVNEEQSNAAQQPVITNNDHSSSDHPADWNNNYERVISIYYYEHYDLDGGVSGQLVNKRIIQMAVNGRWEAVDWLPPEGTFADGMNVQPVHFDEGFPTEAANQHFTVNYFVRSVEIQTVTGSKMVSQAYTLTDNGSPVTIPEIEITNDGIPSAYHPQMKFPGPDNVVQRDGHYYLTGATITFENNGNSFTYHGAYNSQDITGLVSLGEKITFSAPVNFAFKDLDGKTYNAYGDDYPNAAAIYRNVAQVDYGQELSADQIYADAEKYLNKYVVFAYDEPDSAFQVYGYFDPDGEFHQIENVNDYPVFGDAASASDGLTYNIAIIYERYGKTGEAVDPTRTITVTTPDGQTTTTQQVVQLQQFHYYDGITGYELSEPEWKVFTGNDPDNPDSWTSLEDGNHSWDEFNIPTIPGYTTMVDGAAATSSLIPSEAVTDQTANVTVNVDYQPVEPPVTPPAPGTGSDSGTSTPNGNSPVVNATTVTTTSFAPGNATTTKHSASALPQTGNKQNLAALSGLAGLSLAMMLGLGLKKRQ